MTDTFTPRLSEYLDDELSAEDRAALDAHLENCAACRRTLNELRQVVARARACTDEAPVRDLWPGIAARLTPSAVPRIWQRRISITLPQAAAAGVALVLASVTAVWLLGGVDGRPGAPVEGPPPAALRVDVARESYDHAVGDLEQVLAEGRERLDPRTYDAIERNLRTIDRAIAEARQALEADPGNVYLNNHLATARQRKLALLRRATALAHPEG